MVSKVRKKRGRVPAFRAMAATSECVNNPLISEAKLKRLYSTMLQCRILDERARELRSSSGKPARAFRGEAATAGAALDLRRDDWLAPLQADVLGKFLKGVSLATIFSELHPSEAGKVPQRANRTLRVGIAGKSFPLQTNPKCGKPSRPG